MNRINNNDKNFSVDFIPWYQSSDNGLYYYNGIKLDTGLPPTVAQIRNDSSLAVTYPMDASTQALSDKIDALSSNETFMIELATNTFKAHKDFLGRWLCLRFEFTKISNMSVVNGLGGLGGDVW